MYLDGREKRRVQRLNKIIKIVEANSDASGTLSIERQAIHKLTGTSRAQLYTDLETLAMLNRINHLDTPGEPLKLISKSPISYREFVRYLSGAFT